VHNLSYSNGSVNAAISDENKSVRYSSIQDAIAILKTIGPSAFMAKTNLLQAYRQLSVTPKEYHLLGLRWEGKTYFDRAIPMGCSSSSLIFTTFSDTLKKLAINKFGLTHVVAYLDDFLIIAHSRQQCDTDLKSFLQCCAALNLPVADKKTVGATQVIEFLGIQLDARAMTASLPPSKLKILTGS
jgi:hypothetical protein